MTLAKEDPNLKWNDVQAEIEKQFGKINYTRLNGTEGHIAVNVNGTSIDTLQKVCLDRKSYITSISLVMPL